MCFLHILKHLKRVMTSWTAEGSDPEIQREMYLHKTYVS